MPLSLTIDGRPVEVEPGTTVLQAARRLGIAIPTLCHRDGVPPIGSCFLCVVQVEGRSRLIPSCVAPAEDGMVVTTDSEEVRSARRVALELLLSDHVGDCEAPCTLACPAGLDIPGMLRHLAVGQATQAVALVKERIPLAGALGRICPRFCERVCRRRELDEPLAICALKRAVADADGAAPEPWCPPRPPATGKRVAIVGAGPAGLTAAFFLLREGHACTLFDAHDEPGGMFRHAIPAFRLPPEAVAADIEPVRRLGAEFRLNTRLGQDIILEELRDEYDAVLLVLGAQGEDAPDFPGAAHARSALEFLHAVAHGARPDLGPHALILGGGNEAVDAARTAVRLGAGRVTLLWDGSGGAMPAFGDWVAAAEAEGVALETDAAPLRLERRGAGRLVLAVRRGAEERELEASCVIAAPSRRVEADLLESQGLPVEKERLKADRRTLATPLEGVFAAGECVAGPTAGVRAVAAGRLAALSIHQALCGREPTGEPRPVTVRMGKLTEEQKAVVFRDVESRPRADVPQADAARRRANFDEVEGGLSPEAAAREAARCVQCDCAARDHCALRQLATDYGARPSRFAGERRALERDVSHPQVVYEPGKCILCQLCSRVAEQAGERYGLSLTERGFVTRTRVPFGRPLAEGLTEAAAACVEACPTGALAWKRPPAEGG